MFRSIKSRFFTAAVGVIATTQIAMAEMPGERVEVGRVTVSYGDIDLGNVADVRLMLGRLEQAAYRACGGDPRWNPSYALLWGTLNAEYRQCRSDAVSRAVTTVDAPLLSQMLRSNDDQRLVRDAGAVRR
jgi:UrcA family protein